MAKLKVLHFIPELVDGLFGQLKTFFQFAQFIFHFRFGLENGIQGFPFFIFNCDEKLCIKLSMKCT